MSTNDLARLNPPPPHPPFDSNLGDRISHIESDVSQIVQLVRHQQHQLAQQQHQLAQLLEQQQQQRVPSPDDALSRDQLLLTLREYLDLATEAIEINAVAPADHSASTFTGKPRIDSSGEPRVVVAPRHLRPLDDFEQLFALEWNNLGNSFGSMRLLDPLAASSIVHPASPNEGTIHAWIQRHAVAPALDILNATARIANFRQRQRQRLFQSSSSSSSSTSHSSPFLGLLRQQRITRFALVAQLDMPSTWLHGSLPFCDLGPAFNHPASPPSSPALSDMEFRDSIEQQQKNWFGATRPDFELVYRGRSGELKYLTLEVKRKDSFCTHNIRPALHRHDAWLLPELRTQAENGQLPVRQAFVKIAAKLKPLEKEHRYVLECINQEWRYMVQRGHTWGILTSGIATIILQADWSDASRGHDARFFLFEPGQFHIQTPTGVYYPTLADIIVIVSRLNLLAGIQSNRVIQQLGREVHDAFAALDAFDPNDTGSDDGSGDHDHAWSPPYTPQSSLTQDEAPGDTAAEPDSPRPAEPTEADDVASHDARARAHKGQLEALRQKLLARPPRGFVHCQDEATRIALLDAIIAQGQQGELGGLHHSLKLLWPRLILATEAYPLRTRGTRGAGKVEPGHVQGRGRQRVLVCPPSPPDSIESTSTNEPRELEAPTVASIRP